MTTTDNRGLSWLAGLLLENVPTTAGSVDFLVSEVVDAIAVGLPLQYDLIAPLPTVDAERKLYIAAKALTLGLSDAPDVTRAIWPSNFVPDSRTINVQSSLTSPQTTPNLASAVRSKIQAGLDVIMNDVSAFISLTRAGHFSGPDYLTFDTSSAHLDQGIRTYAVANLLNRNSFAGRFLAASNITSTANAACSTQTVCFPLPGAQAVGGLYIGNKTAIYTSPYIPASYELTRPPVSPYQVMAYPDWGDLSALMDRGFLCHAAGNDLTQIVNHPPGRPLNFNCVSKLNFCYTADSGGCPAAMSANTGSCPISPCTES